MKKTITIILLLIILSCSKDEDSPPQNTNPEQLKLESVSFQGQEVTIDWNDVVDADDDIIYYNIYINSILVAESNKSINTSHIEYNNEYDCRIIATDKNGGISELEFTFESPKSKILFFSDFYGNLTAYDLITDKILWESKTSHLEAHTAYKDIIYSGLNGINTINILSGEIVWTSTPSVNYNLEYRNIISDETYVYAFDSDSNLYCVSIDNGEKLWERSFLNYYATLSIDESKIYVSSNNDDNLYALDKYSGNIDWSFRLTSGATEINTNPLIDDNNIYFGDNIGRFYSFNKNEGILNWSFDAGLYNNFYASPTTYENTIIAATGNTLYAFDKETSNVKWSYYRSNGGIESSPFIYNNNVYIGFSNNGTGELVCLNADDGNVKWKYDLSNNTTTSPIVFEDTVYIGDWDKNFYAINANTGTLNWKLQTKEFITKSPTIVIGNSETVIYPSSHGLKN